MSENKHEIRVESQKPNTDFRNGETSEYGKKPSVTRKPPKKD